MKQTLTTYDIAEALINDEYGGWSRAGAFAMAEHLEQYEEDTGEELDLDVVAIRCDYSEFDGLLEWAKDYHTQDQFNGIFEDEIDSGDEDDLDEAIRDYINDQGQLIEFDGGIIVSSF
jgi:hypothetical protein